METVLSLFILLAIVVVLTNELYQQKNRVSCMPTTAHVRREIMGLVPTLTGGRIMELGSGWGGICFSLARQFPDREVVGIESSFFPYWFSRLRARWLGLSNLTLLCEDFFDADFRRSALTVCYLSNPIMKRLAGKFRAELPADAILVSSTFFVPDWAPEKVLDVQGLWNTRIFVYRKAA